MIGRTSINPHACALCGAGAWTSPAVAPDGRPCFMLSLHLNPNGALCPRGGFSLEEAAPTPERQRRWCAEAMRHVLSRASEDMVEVLAACDDVFARPPADAIGLAAECHAAVERARETVFGADEEYRRSVALTTDTCRALSTAADVTWDEVDPEGRIRGRLRLYLQLAALQDEEASSEPPKRRRGRA